MNLPPSLLNWLNHRNSALSHRQILVISGEQNWAQEVTTALADFVKNDSLLWVGDNSPNHGQSIHIQEYRQHLGQEYANCVINCFSGFRASALMALSGTIKKHGLLIICCPTFKQWPQYSDPEQKNRISYGFNDSFQHSYFIQYFCAALTQDKSVAKLSKEHFIGPSHFVEQTSCQDLFKDQSASIDAIIKVATGRNNRPLIITAHRGRGKSSALGLASAQLMQKQPITIWLTSPNINNVKQVFYHCNNALEQTTTSKNHIEHQSSRLCFKAIDFVMQSDEKPDLLLIDEASALPVSTLIKLSEKYSRIVFSATQHGYEGSGRGFEIRFKQQLIKLKPNTKMQQLNQPIRWFNDDCLEQFWFKTFFYSYTLGALESDLKTAKTEFRQLQQQELLANKTLLGQVFSHLLDAHYQTSPDDLQRLLDSPETRLYIATKNNHLIAVAQLTEEGGPWLLPLATEIAENSRRVKGHLVAQNLGASYHLPAFCRAAQWRISRIAVASDYQRAGVASQLLEYVQKDAKSNSIEFITSAFGGSAELLNFWHQVGFTPAKVSLKAEISSGEHSCIYIQGLTDGAQQLSKIIHAEFVKDLTYFMDKELQIMQPACLINLLKGSASLHHRTNQAIVEQFMQGKRTLDSCRRVLITTLLRHADTIVKLVAQDQALLVSLLLQNKPLNNLVSEFDITGKKQLTLKVRELISKLLANDKN